MSAFDDQAGTIPEFFDAAVTAHPDRVFVRDADLTYTYRQFQDLTLRAASTFQQRGIAVGDRVALLLPNSSQHLAAWFGLNRLGAISIGVNPRLAGPEIQRLLAFLQPALVVTDHSAISELTSVRMVHPGILFDSVPDLIPAAVTSHHLATFIATSGSTGMPKAVMQSHRTYVLTGQSFPAWVGLTSQDCLMVVLPLHHINAQAYSVMGAIGAGASLALVPRFSAGGFWDDARRLGATQVNVVGAMVEILDRQPYLADDAFNPVRLCYTALALAQEKHRGFEDRFNLQMLVGYGMSETTFGTVWPRYAPCPYGTIGYLRQHPFMTDRNMARVVDEAGNDVPVGVIGELLLQNPATMAGYFHAEAETAEVLRDGWLHTGDLVVRSVDASFRFVARKKEIIRRRGENIAPAEIETVLLDHPGVKEAAVIGVPSDLGEEDLRAFVVLHDGVQLDGVLLREWCLARLASFKVPGEFEFRDSLPRTETARIVRRELR